MVGIYCKSFSPIVIATPRRRSVKLESSEKLSGLASGEDQKKEGGNNVDASDTTCYESSVGSQSTVDSSIFCPLITEI